MAKIQPDLLSASDDFPVVFGRYTLLGVLGEGGMARVFRAELQGLEGFRKKAAIKIIRASVAASNADLGKALVNEARLGGLLHHPNVVETYEYGVVDNLPFIAMEYVRGIGLDEILDHGPQLTPGHILEISAQICAGLDHAHNLEDAGVETELVHRDLKPSNILLSRDGLVKVMDFGIAKAAALSTSMTQTGMTKGTPAYMSPEQVAGDPLDRRSDIFAMGAIVYELALGSRMFSGDSLMTVLAAVLQVEERLERSDSRTRLDAVVPGLADIVFRCMRKEPSDRYSDAAEVEDALKALLKHQESGESLRSFVRGFLKQRPGGLGSMSTDSGVEVAPTLATPDAALMAARGTSADVAQAVGPTVEQPGYGSVRENSSPSESHSGPTPQAPSIPSEGAARVSGSVSVEPELSAADMADTRTVAPDASIIGAAASDPVPPTRLVGNAPPAAMPSPPPTPAAGTPSQGDGTLWATPQNRRSALWVLLFGLAVGLLLAVAVGVGAVLLWKSSDAQKDGLTEQQAEESGLGGLDSFPVAAQGDDLAASTKKSDPARAPVGRKPGATTSTASSPDKVMASSRSTGAASAKDSETASVEEPTADTSAAGRAGGMETVAAEDSVQPPDEPRKPLASPPAPVASPSPPPASPPRSLPASNPSPPASSKNTVSRPKHLHMGELKGRVIERSTRGTRIEFKGRIYGATEGRATLYYNPPKARWLKRKMDCGGDRWCSTVVSLEGVSKGRVVYYVSVKGRQRDGQEKGWRSKETDFRINP